jgi:hypothetical protein
MHWYYDEKELTTIPEGYIGFVYEITNTVTGTKYIGKKQFYFRKTRQVKGKKKRYLAESDWIDYYGSSETFKQLVEDHGKDKFVRKILRLCKTKGELSYFESKEIFLRDAILDETYANAWISCKIRSTHLKHIIKNEHI